MNKEKWKQKRQRPRLGKRAALDFLIMVGLLFCAGVVSMLLVQWTNSSSNVTAMFTLAVLLIARTTDGYGWGILASVLGVFAVNYMFTAPYFQFNFTTTGYPVIFISLLLISVITSAATDNIKRQASRARKNEERTRKLYEFSQQLTGSDSTDEMIDLTLHYLHDFLSCPVIYVKDANSIYNNEERVCGEIDGFVSPSIECSAINDCIRMKCDTGAGTMYSPYAMFRYIPLVCGDMILGCIGVSQDSKQMSVDTAEHVRMILAQFGISLEHQMLTEERNRAARAADREKLRNNLLRSISHDLRTPLTCIIGASAVIMENGDRIDPSERKRLVTDIHEDAEWLLRMVENLLSVTRVTQATKLEKSEEAVEEVISEAVTRCKKRYPDAQIRVSMPDEMMFVPMDVTLIVQVLINLIENAVRYAATPVDVSFCRDGDRARFTVRDFGPGIDEEKHEMLFESAGEKHPDSRRGGLGIGLTLCKSIITAHGGDIYEVNHPDGGAQFVFTLPIEEES